MVNRGKEPNMRSAVSSLKNAASSRVTRLLLVILVFSGTLPVSSVKADSGSAEYEEYVVKAAFIYNFLKFIDWPEEKITGDGNRIIVGIIGKDPFGSAVKGFSGKSLEGRKLVVERFEGIHRIQEMAKENQKDFDKTVDALRKCHLLFVCPSEKKQFLQIVEIVDKYHVVTVGDGEGFIESGGIINFSLKENKVRFEVNLVAAEKAGLKIRSQLLRLAKRVIREEQPQAD